jgi:hypothetical protein
MNLPELWQSQTSHNPTEVQYDFAFLKERILRHQGSFPTSIVSAIDHFAKGTKMIMHKLALQEAELKDLREANRELTNRRKHKKKQLRNGGLLSFQDARDLQTAQEVDEQIQQETRDFGGRKKRTDARGRRCTKCGKTGYNIRTCDIELKSFGEEDSNWA